MMKHLINVLLNIRTTLEPDSINHHLLANSSLKSEKTTRTEAREKQNRKEKVSDVKFTTSYNPALLNINEIIKK